MSVPRFAAITVTYNPDLAVLERQLGGLAQAAVVVVVDNASAALTVTALRHLVGPRHILIEHPTNEGLAAGLNAGARAALERDPQCEFLLFLDQDTEPGADGAARLIAAAAALRASDPQVGLVGPLMVDAASGLSHGIHQMRGYRWTQAHPDPAGARTVPCASVNGSGMVVPTDVFRAAGEFDESLFIDHVDSEYSFRVASAGYSLHAVPGIRFVHRMGERTMRFWLARWRLWPYRSPERHRYLFRNAVVLMRRSYVPAVWKAWAVAKLAATMLVHLVIDPRRFRQVGSMARGIREGLRPPGGGAT